MAIRALLQFDDPCSALTLAGAAERVLRDKQPKDATLSAGFHSVGAFCNEVIAPSERTLTAKKIDFAYDQLRHADVHRDHEHVLDLEGVEMFLLLTVWAYAGKPKGSEQAFYEWFYGLPPMLGAFVIWMFFNYENTTWDRRPDENFPKLKSLRSDKRLAFDELVELVESKSLIPNPKSLKETAQ